MIDRVSDWIVRGLTSVRTPEPEVMGTHEEAQCYAHASNQKGFGDADAAVLAWVRSLGPAGTVVDIATGPGQIPIMLASRHRHLRVVGVDRSEAMVQLARQHARAAAVGHRVSFLVADAHDVPLPSACADVVLCNSSLHHFSDPVRVLDEVGRLVTRRGAVFVRDLWRPPRWLHRPYAGHFGRHYAGLARTLFERSVRAAYTRRELQQLVARSRLAGARVFRCDTSHIAVEKRT